jgi:hypothetical protein
MSGLFNIPARGLAPEEFFAQIIAQWNWLEDMRDSEPGEAIFETRAHNQSPRRPAALQIMVLSSNHP